MDELHTPGARPFIAKSKELHYAQASKIEDEGIRRAQESVWHFKRIKLPKPKVNFCADESDPPLEHQEPRHRAKKVTRGFQTVPYRDLADGSREYAFEHKHLYGVMGILITAGITQNRRITDHWGMELHDNYPLVRACMPRDLFVLFYGRFFHLAPATTATTTSGIKCWAGCCPSGYCFVQSIDGGFSGDIKLRPHASCPIGKSARTVVYVLLEACETFSDKIIGSGVTVAMDNFFTGAALLRYLATRDIFAVRTPRGNRTGVDLSNYIWSKEGMKVTERGQMLRPARTSSKRAADHNGEKVSSSQPLARKEHVKNMGGVDVADQWLGAHAHTHRPMTFFWRRVFDQKFSQAVSNAWFLFYE
ncbi:unnamed protein product [Ectocarpus sp. CCAP 1310/34]|nr:unnamed protein product [Ectocarpus sp. CCAP 1310/34]